MITLAVLAIVALGVFLASESTGDASRVIREAREEVSRNA